MSELGDVVKKGQSLVKTFASSGTKVSSAVVGSGTPVVSTSKEVLDKARGINTDGTKQAGVQSTVIETTVSKNQPATTPKAGVSVNTNTDAYRYGGGSGDASLRDNIAWPRTLGEPDEETVAYLSISTQVDSSLSAYYADSLRSKNASSALGQNAVVQGDVITAYSRFFLQNVTESQAEKYQVVETFTSFYTFFYGKKPTVYSFVGTLLNDENHKWVNDFMFFYENFFRGTRTADAGAQAVMTYDGRVVSGFILDISIQQSADMHKGAQFSMNMLVTEHIPVQFSADITTLIEQAQADLIAESARISQQVSSINRNVPAEVAQSAKAAVAGQVPASRVKQNKKAVAVTNKKGKSKTKTS